MPQDLIGCRKRRKLKALIPRVVVFVNDPSSAERRIDFAAFFIVLWSYGRKICLNMCLGNSENSYGCSYLPRICFIYGTNVSVSRSWIPLQGPLTRCLLIYQQTSASQNTVHLKTGFIWKFSREWLNWAGYARNLNRQLWSIRRKILHRCSRNFCRHYYKSWWLKVTDWLFAFAFCKI